jgi:hydroxyacylglutathione hydrolase
MVYPTHGAGSLCSTNIATTSWSTIGYERRHDPLLAIRDIDAFARALLAGQPTFPRYFARMRPINQAGPRLLGGRVPPIDALDGTDLDRELAGDALVIDARPAEAHAARRIPGSLSVPAGSSFGTWLGWMVDADRPVVLLVDDLGELDGIARQALRIGFESIAGYIEGGLRGWQAAGRPFESGSVVDVDRLAADIAGADAPLVIDVRQAAEFESGHVPGAIHIGAGELPAMLDALPRDRPIATVCASGYRSSVAASMLRAAGFERVSSVTAGVPTWAAHGYPIEYGPPDGDAAPGPADPSAAEAGSAGAAHAESPAHAESSAH